MKGYVFDPSRLRGSVKQQERRGYAMVAGMLREHLGGDPLADFRRRARRDPVLRAAVQELVAQLRAVVERMGPSRGDNDSAAGRGEQDDGV